MAGLIMAGLIEKIDKKHYKWTPSTTKDTDTEAIYRDFYSLLGREEGFKDLQKGNFTIIAESIVPLRELIPMDYNQVENMIRQVGLQLEVLLLKYKKGILYLNVEDIIVIDRSFFFLRGLENVIGLQKEELLITYPLKIEKADEQFIAPELKQKMAEKVLPFKTSLTGVYYSLGKLCLYCLQLEDLETLNGSKMYYFLERCLKVDPTERYFLYI